MPCLFVQVFYLNTAFVFIKRETGYIYVLGHVMFLNTLFTQIAFLHRKCYTNGIYYIDFQNLFTMSQNTRFLQCLNDTH